MSKIQDLIDLKLMHPDGEEIYEKRDDDYEYNLLKEGITVVLRNASDYDPGMQNGYSTECGRSVAISYGSGLYKSHEEEISYSGSEWTAWREVNAIPKIQYNYVESAY